MFGKSIDAPVIIGLRALTAVVKHRIGATMRTEEKVCEELRAMARNETERMERDSVFAAQGVSGLFLYWRVSRLRASAVNARTPVSMAGYGRGANNGECKAGVSPLFIAAL